MVIKITRWMAIRRKVSEDIFINIGDYSNYENPF